MTAAIGLISAVAGIAVGVTIARIWITRSLVRCDEWHYRQIQAEPAHVPPTADPNLRIVSIADHEHRLQLRVDARTRELRESVGDLLDIVATLRTQLDERRSPVPAYGNYRRNTA